MEGSRARIALLIGDPAGIGPEIVVKAVCGPKMADDVKVFVIADSRAFALGQAQAGIRSSLPTFDRWEDAEQASSNAILFELPGASPDEYTSGRVSAAAGRATLDSMDFAAELAARSAVDAIVYAPLNKQALHLGGSPFSDELHFFADRLGPTGPCGELNVLDDLWTARVTSHVAIREVSDLVTSDRVFETLVLADESLRRAGREAPRIAVSALNPHAGEGGLFGHEEQTAIASAIERARAGGISADGPFPADTVFLRARSADYDGVVSMYHDQGQIATKLLGFARGVTVLGGLPIPVVTPAHGTAFDIVGKRAADPQALLKALSLAARMGAV